MNISSLYQYASLYMPAYNASTSSTTQSSSQAGTGSDNFSAILGTTLSNSDGDTAQLSSSGMAGMPPMMGNDTTASDIKSFLDKVANGTATSTDLKTMETELGQAASSTSSTSTSTGSSTGTSNIGADIKSFLDKVANGTATSTDLKTMETELGQAASSTSSTSTSTGSSTGTSNIGADIKSFLDKVANGTATSTDLKTMETELGQAASTNTTNTDSTSANNDLATVLQSSISQQMLNSAIYAYSNNNAGYLWNSTQSTTA